MQKSEVFLVSIEKDFVKKLLFCRISIKTKYNDHKILIIMNFDLIKLTQVTTICLCAINVTSVIQSFDLEYNDLEACVFVVVLPDVPRTL